MTRRGNQCQRIRCDRTARLLSRFLAFRPRHCLFKTCSGSVSTLHIDFKVQRSKRDPTLQGHLQRLVPSFQHLNDGGIELLASRTLHDLHGFFKGHGFAIGPVRGKRVKAVDHAQNARAKRNCFTLQTVGVAAPVPSLMVRSHDRNDRVGKTHTLQDVCADSRMNLHLFKFVHRQLSRFVDDVFRHGKFANVMQKRCDLQRFDLQLIQTHRGRDVGHIIAHPKQMLVSIVILGLDRHCETFNGAQVQGFGFLQVSPARLPVRHLGVVSAK